MSDPPGKVAGGRREAVSAEENKALARRAIEEMFNEGNLDVADELLAPDYVDHDASSPEEIRGPEGFKRFVATARSAFPDTHVRIEEQVAEGDLVATRYVFSGTQEGELEGIPPTGNRVEFSGISIDRISGGKLAETWDNYDAMGMMQQLGVIPSPEQAQA
jgi:steroid delta-isomerase-like uncharacterized protein